jgi:hypothetical protein
MTSENQALLGEGATPDPLGLVLLTNSKCTPPLTKKLATPLLNSISAFNQENLTTVKRIADQDEILKPKRYRKLPCLQGM